MHRILVVPGSDVEYYSAKVDQELMVVRYMKLPATGSQALLHSRNDDLLKSLSCVSRLHDRLYGE